MATQKKPDVFLNMLWRPGKGVLTPWGSVLDLHRARAFGPFLPKDQQARVTIFPNARRAAAQQQSRASGARRSGSGSSSGGGSGSGPSYFSSSLALSQSALEASFAPSQAAALVGQSQFLDGSATAPDDAAMDDDGDEVALAATGQGAAAAAGAGESQDATQSSQGAYPWLAAGGASASQGGGDGSAEPLRIETEVPCEGCRCS